MESTKEQSEKWLREFCDANDCPSYDSIMEVITDGSAQLGDSEYYGESYIDGEYMFFNGVDAHGDIPDEFWDHVEVVTGKKVAPRPVYFSCSC